MLHDQFLIVVENFIERIIITVFFAPEILGAQTKLELVLYLSACARKYSSW